MRRRAVAIAACLALAVAGALAVLPSEARAPSEPRLVVTEQIVKSDATYIEGAYWYLVLKRVRDGHVVFRRRYSGRMHLDKRFPGGRYRLVSYVRSCAGTCGYLDSPSGRCAAKFSMRRGARVHAVVRTEVGEPCRIRIESR
jgi:hypothetical protein